MNVNEYVSQGGVVLALKRLYESYGYSLFKMSKFEEYELYVRNKSFLVSENIITFPVWSRATSCTPALTALTATPTA